MTILDDIETIRKADPSNMYNRIFDLPEQMSDALTLAQRWQIDADEFSRLIAECSRHSHSELRSRNRM